MTKRLKYFLIASTLIAAVAIGVAPGARAFQQAVTFWQVLVKTNVTIQPTTTTGPTPFQLLSPSGATAADIAATGTLTSAGVIDAGMVPTITGCGVIGSQTGGPTTGSFTAGSTSCTPVITTGITAPHGWACIANDLTTTADKLVQSASSATTCTLTGTVASADVIVFSAKGY